MPVNAYKNIIEFANMLVLWKHEKKESFLEMCDIFWRWKNKNNW